MQIGYPAPLWPVALVKELIDNALDACESASIRSEIAITIESDSVSVADNGPGIPSSTIERSLDYFNSVSDKAHYVSPTRGQLGNALKCVWAAPYVASGQIAGCIEVSTCGQIHYVDVTLDRIAQIPNLVHRVVTDGLVKNGTLVRMHWSEIAGLLDKRYLLDSYITPNIETLVNGYSLFNPHAQFSLLMDGEEVLCPAMQADWQKWKPNNPTSPHWYTLERIKSLIAAYVTAERSGGKARTVREFVSEFAGLTGTAKQKAVTDEAELSGAYLHDLVDGGDIASDQASWLLQAMKLASRTIRPSALGVIGQEHLKQKMAEDGVAPESIRYRKVEGVAGGAPFVLEVIFGAYEDGEYDENRRQTFVGLNWTPLLRNPISRLSDLLGQMRVNRGDPVLLIVHLASPRLEFTDRGKSSLAAGSEILAALEKCVTGVATQWKQEKRHADRNDRLNRQALERVRRSTQARVMSIKDASYRAMEQAYMDASAGGSLPANARQIMYSARPLVLKLTGGRLWKESSTFTQQYLNDFIEDNPALTGNWNVVFDARGQFIEPHTARRVELGTLGVRQYVQSWSDDISEDPKIELEIHSPTSGPSNRYKFVLFVEKEGFNELWKAVDLASRYDIAIMSTKGMSVTAARELVERLSERGVTILVLRDFDKSGFSIVHTLKTNTRRYRFKTKPKVIDLGLRLADIKELNLQSEYVSYNCKVDPRENLRARGATKKECDFLVRHGSEGTNWHGERVELNALGSSRLVEWLERKLQFVGVEKLIPSNDVLAEAYQRAVIVARLQMLIGEALAEGPGEIVIPSDLAKRIRSSIKGKSLSWDEAVFKMASNDMNEPIE